MRFRWEVPLVPFVLVGLIMLAKQIRIPVPFEELLGLQGETTPVRCLVTLGILAVLVALVVQSHRKA